MPSLSIKFIGREFLKIVLFTNYAPAMFLFHSLILFIKLTGLIMGQVGHGTKTQDTWVLVSSLCGTEYVTLGKLLCISELHYCI